MKTLATVSMALAFLGSVAAPLSAYAYLSPQQVFGSSTLPSTRTGEDTVAARQAAASSSRAAAHEALVSIDDEPTDTYVAPPSSFASSSGLLDQTVQYEKRQERLKAAAGDFGENTLHSGAPLITRSGPASLIAGIILALATLSTLAFCAHRSRTMTLAPTSL